LDLYKKADDYSQKAALTWALAYIGNAEVATNFLWLVSNRFHWKEINEEQEDLCLETIQSLGFLATRYEAAFELLKKGSNPSWWQEHRYWLSPRGYQSAGLAASACIRGLGLSGRPEAADALADLRKKGLEYKLKEYPGYARNFASDVAKAKSYQENFQMLGALASQRVALGGDLGLGETE